MILHDHRNADVGDVTQCLYSAQCPAWATGSIRSQPEDGRAVGAGAWTEGLRWKLTGPSSLTSAFSCRGSAHTFDSEPGPSLSQSSSGSETEDTHRSQDCQH